MKVSPSGRTRAARVRHTAAATSGETLRPSNLDVEITLDIAARPTVYSGATAAEFSVWRSSDSVDETYLTPDELDSVIDTLGAAEQQGRGAFVVVEH